MEAYFPKMDTSLATRSYPSRPAGMVLSDLNRKDDNVTSIREMERWRDRIYEAIDTMTVKHPDGTTSSISGPDGIDIFGNLLECSDLSVNMKYYGDYHKSGHRLLGYCHDPDQRYNVS